MKLFSATQAGSAAAVTAAQFEGRATREHLAATGTGMSNQLIAGTDRIALGVQAVQDDVHGLRRAVGEQANNVAATFKETAECNITVSKVSEAVLQLQRELLKHTTEAKRGKPAELHDKIDTIAASVTEAKEAAQDAKALVKSGATGEEVRGLGSWSSIARVWPRALRRCARALLTQRPSTRTLTAILNTTYH